MSSEAVDDDVRNIYSLQALEVFRRNTAIDGKEALRKMLDENP
jgi:hypothetical protein